MTKYLWLRRIFAVPLLILIPYILLIDWLEHKYKDKKHQKKYPEAPKSPFGLQFEIEEALSGWKENFWDK